MDFIEVYQDCDRDCQYHNQVVFQTDNLFSMSILGHGKQVYITGGKDGATLPRLCPSCGWRAIYHFRMIEKA